MLTHHAFSHVARHAILCLILSMSYSTKEKPGYMRQNRFLASDSASKPRLVGVIGIIVSTLLFLSIAIYAFTQRQSILPATGITIPGLPTQPVVTCTTPQHALGDTTGSITSSGLKRTFLVHLPSGYGVQPQPLV